MRKYQGPGYLVGLGIFRGFLLEIFWGGYTKYSASSDLSHPNLSTNPICQQFYRKWKCDKSGTLRISEKNAKFISHAGSKIFYYLKASAEWFRKRRNFGRIFRERTLFRKGVKIILNLIRSWTLSGLIIKNLKRYINSNFLNFYFNLFWIFHLFSLWREPSLWCWGYFCWSVYLCLWNQL